MGATILTGKHAAAFKRTDGTAIYALFERTYEANCYPHTPRWHCRAIGTYADAVRAIALGMASCESQGLQAPSSMIRPESYLSSWYRYLTKPTALPDQVIEVNGAGHAQLSESYRSQAVSVLLAMGRTSLAEELLQGATNINLYEDIDVVLRLFGVAGVLRPWQALRYDDVMALPATGFPVPFVAAKRGVGALMNPKHDVLRIDDHQVLVRSHGGMWRCWGYQYSAVQRFMDLYTREMESVKRMSSIAAITAFRQKCASAPRLANDTVVTIAKPGFGAEDYVVRQFDKLANCFPAVGGAAITVSLSAAVEKAMLSEICYMPLEYVQWHVMEIIAPVCDAAGGLVRKEQEQLDLLV